MPSINKKAILSGALGASASLIAKLALSPDSPVPSSVHSSCRTLFESVAVSLCPALSFASRVICLLLMIGLNAIMISSFLDGMNESGSVVGSALSTAANFSCSVSQLILVHVSTFFLGDCKLTLFWGGRRLIQPTYCDHSTFKSSLQALYGAVFFREYVSMTWYLGATLIGIGMWMLSSVALIGS
ncbi:hypothetical protein ACHAWX_000243 [Stephanocyclus meneghinianus]